MPPRHFSLFPQRTWACALSILVAAWFGELLAEGGEPFVEQQGPPFARWTWTASASGTYVNQVSPDRNDAVPVNQPVVGQGVLQMDGGKTGDPADDRYVEVGQLSPPMSGATYMQWTFLDLVLPDSPDGQSHVLAGSLQSGFGPGTTFTITANEDRDDTAADGLADVSLSLFVNPDEGLKAESVTARARNVIAIATRVGLRITYAGAGRGQSKGTVAVEILAPQESEWTPIARTKIDVGQINPSPAARPIRTYIGKYDPSSTLASTFSVGEVAVSFADPHPGERDLDAEMTTATERPVPTAAAELLEQHRLKAGRVEQGLALAENFHFGATARTLYRFDTKWQLIDSREITIEGANHMGAIDYHKPFIWAGFLNHGKTDGKYDASLNRSIIAKIDADKLEVVQTWDITDDCTWIDPVAFDGKYLWVGEMNNLGIHRYRLEGGDLVRAGVLRYPSAMSFSQGVRVRGKRLYSIHTFGSMDGLFEFEIPEELTEDVVQPVRVWPIQETVLHLEGFDFIPGTNNEIWHAQSSQVDRYRLHGVDFAVER